MMDITEIKSAVRSLTRGRARLRHEKLQGLDAETIANVESFLMGLEGVTGAQINPRVGSLLLTWDPAATSAEALLESAGFFLAFLGDDEANANEAPASEKNPAEEKAAAACEAACAAASRYAKTVEGAVARTGGAWAATESVTPAELCRIPLVLRESGSGTLEVIAAALAGVGIRLQQLRVALRLGTTEGIKSFVRHSDAMAILSVISVVEELRRGTLRIIDIEGLTLTRDFSFVHLAAEPVPLARQFEEFARAEH